jgi:hypothetical protein
MISPIEAVSAVAESVRPRDQGLATGAAAALFDTVAFEERTSADKVGT